MNRKEYREKYLKEYLSKEHKSLEELKNGFYFEIKRAFEAGFKSADDSHKEPVLFVKPIIPDNAKELATELANYQAPLEINNNKHDAFIDYPQGNHAVIAYSHYYHKWMVVNEEEDAIWDTKWWETERYKNSFVIWAYVDDFLNKGEHNID
jgi:hypothetical protein